MGKELNIKPFEKIQNIYILEYEEIEMHGVGTMNGEGIYKEYNDQMIHYPECIGVFTSIRGATKAFEEVARKEKEIKPDKWYETDNKNWFVTNYRLSRLVVRDLSAVEKCVNKQPEALHKMGVWTMNAKAIRDLFEQNDDIGNEQEILEDALYLDTDIFEILAPWEEKVREEMEG